MLGDTCLVFLVVMLLGMGSKCFFYLGPKYLNGQQPYNTDGDLHILCEVTIGHGIYLGELLLRVHLYEGHLTVRNPGKRRHLFRCD